MSDNKDPSIHPRRRRLGLNREELVKNPRLTDHVVHDLNVNPLLPFGDQEFEAVICTLSVESSPRREA
jgi:hypothetical protein